MSHYRRRYVPGGSFFFTGIRPNVPAYNLERMEVKCHVGYESMFKRTGKYRGGVNRLDY
jgi:hypothetical protein